MQVNNQPETPKKPIKANLSVQHWHSFIQILFLTRSSLGFCTNAQKRPFFASKHIVMMRLEVATGKFGLYRLPGSSQYINDLWQKPWMHTNISGYSSGRYRSFTVRRQLGVPPFCSEQAAYACATHRIHQAAQKAQGKV